MLITGCADNRPTVTLSTTKGSFSETFTHGSCTTIAGGDDVVVLWNDASAATGLRQILRIRTLWRPILGAKGDSPASTNAALHYFVLTSPAANAGYIHYAGTGFVTVDRDGSTAAVQVRNARLSWLDARGPLVDPLGTFKLSGDFSATVDDRQVQAVLATLSAAVPSRTTTGPTLSMPAP